MTEETKSKLEFVSFIKYYDKYSTSDILYISEYNMH